MTLYDEVGLSRQATPEEIKHAYRNLARMLHPDTAAGEEMRRLAEAQMRRINAAFDVLNDPVRRAAYDADLAAGNFTSTVATGYPIPQPKPVSRPLVAAVVIGWISLFVFAMWWRVLPAGGGGKLTRTQVETNDDPVLPEAEPTSTAAVVSPELAIEVRRLRQELRVAREPEYTAEPDTPEDEQEDTLELAETEAAEPELAEPVALAAKSVPQPSPAATRPSAPVARAAPVANVFGTWLYAQRPGEVPKKDWYPPDFIELKIHPGGAGLVGSYQARYRVGDLAISPEVRFRFEGKATDNRGEALSFIGANGVRGEVRLRQTSPLTLQVDWVTTKTGNTPALTSGSSLLVKSPE